MNVWYGLNFFLTIFFNDRFFGNPAFAVLFIQIGFNYKSYEIVKNVFVNRYGSLSAFWEYFIWKNLLETKNSKEKNFKNGDI